MSIKKITFSDGSYLEYGEGKFDNWCVFLSRPNIPRYAPKDKEYFERLTRYAQKYDSQKVYNDFIEIYKKTTKEPSDKIFDRIKTIAQTYKTDATNVAIDFSIIYMGMVSEENKKNTKLGKRIKRLGVHQLLMEDLDYNEAANFSKGKNWKELDELCTSKGF